MFFITQKDKFNLDIVVMVSDDADFVKLHTDDWEETSLTPEPGDHWYEGQFIKPGGDGYEAIRQIIHNAVEEENLQIQQMMAEIQAKYLEEQAEIAAQQEVAEVPPEQPELSLEERVAHVKAAGKPAPFVSTLSDGEHPNVHNADPGPLGFTPVVPESTQENLEKWQFENTELGELITAVKNATYADHVVTFNSPVTLGKGTDHEHTLSNIPVPYTSLQDYENDLQLRFNDQLAVIAKIKKDLNIS